MDGLQFCRQMFDWMERWMIVGELSMAEDFAIHNLPSTIYNQPVISVLMIH